MSKTFNFLPHVPESTDQFEACCNLLNTLSKLTLQSPKFVLRQYENLFEDDFRILDCCDNVKSDCYCDSDAPYYDDDYYDDRFDEKTEDKPSNNGKV